MLALPKFLLNCNFRWTFHQTCLMQITFPPALENSDPAFTTSLQKRSPGTTASRNHVSSSSGSKNNTPFTASISKIVWQNVLQDYIWQLKQPVYPYNGPFLREMRRGMRKFLPAYKKVVFRAYRDKDFLQPVSRGELQDHLGIMGPFIRTEVKDLLTVSFSEPFLLVSDTTCSLTYPVLNQVIFKNKASRPYSFHLHGVYDRNQGAGVAQTSSSSAPPGLPGEPVPPGEARTYNWKISKKQGPTDSEFDCKTGAYYSTVDKVCHSPISIYLL